MTTEEALAIYEIHEEETAIARKREDIALHKELQERAKDLEKRYDQEKKRIIDTPCPSLRERPKRIALPEEQTMHEKWKKEELGRLDREFEELRQKEDEYANEKEKQLQQKWAVLAERQEAERQRKMEQALLEQFDSRDIQLLQKRCEGLEEAYISKQEEVKRLRQEVEQLRLKELVTHGNWLYRTAAVESVGKVEELVNRIQPSPYHLMGCVALPNIHVWIKDVGQPTGMTYTIMRDRWNHDKITSLIQTGSAVLIGATNSGEVFYFRIDRPVVYHFHSQNENNELLALNQFPVGSMANHDISGVPVTDNDLRTLFAKFDQDGNGSIEANEFIGFYKSMEMYGLTESDLDLDSLLANCGVKGEPTLSYEQFAVLMLRMSKR